MATTKARRRRAIRRRCGQVSTRCAPNDEELTDHAQESVIDRRRRRGCQHYDQRDSKKLIDLQGHTPPPTSRTFTRNRALRYIVLRCISLSGRRPERMKHRNRPGPARQGLRTVGAIADERTSGLECRDARAPARRIDQSVRRSRRPRGPTPSGDHRTRTYATNKGQFEAVAARRRSALGLRRFRSGCPCRAPAPRAGPHTGDPLQPAPALAHRACRRQWTPARPEDRSTKYAARNPCGQRKGE